MISKAASWGSKVMRQSGADTLITEEPDERMVHVRICGGAGRATAGSTRMQEPYRDKVNPHASSKAGASAPGS